MSSEGALAGVRVLEFAAIGPVPFCGMVLADMGAEVIRIERPGASDLGIPVDPRFDHLNRGKRSLALDLKQPAAAEAVHRLLAGAQVLLEGFRPGTMERLGFGPAAVLACNPALVYGRISGWGESGPLAGAAGHDLNFLAASGALAAMGDPGAPPPVPLNLIGDFGGAAMHLACGILAALRVAERDGAGQVVATSIAAGAVALTPMLHGLQQAGLWSDRRADNILDGGAPFYRCYATADGRAVAVGAIEAKFYRTLLAGLGLLDAIEPGRQMDRATWPDTTAPAGGPLCRRPDGALGDAVRRHRCVRHPGAELCGGARLPAARGRRAFPDRCRPGPSRPATRPFALAEPHPRPGAAPRAGHRAAGRARHGRIDPLA